MGENPESPPRRRALRSISHFDLILVGVMPNSPQAAIPPFPLSGFCGCHFACRFYSLAMRAIYPGSFDPITNGHLDVIHRAARLFDELLVAVAFNDQKSGIFDVKERVALIREATRGVGNIRVASFEGLLVDFARRESAAAVVRGLRAISDFEFEFQMALMNRKLEPTIETIFLTPREEYTYLSSRIVKEIARLGGNVEAFVPAAVASALRGKFAASVE
jgi:pantetheine-phosphate adenylyltransferase